jgi:hypothetical protein
MADPHHDGAAAGGDAPASAASSERTSCAWLPGSSSAQQDTNPAANSSRAMCGCDCRAAGETARHSKKSDGGRPCFTAHRPAQEVAAAAATRAPAPAPLAAAGMRTWANAWQARRAGDGDCANSSTLKWRIHSAQSSLVTRALDSHACGGSRVAHLELLDGHTVKALIMK